MSSEQQPKSFEQLSRNLALLEKDRQQLQQACSLVGRGIYPECYRDYVEYGGDDSEVREAILDDLRSKLTTVNTKYNNTNDMIDQLDLPPCLYFKKKTSKRQVPNGPAILAPTVNFQNIPHEIVGIVEVETTMRPVRPKSKRSCRSFRSLLVNRLRVENFQFVLY